jgi:hypothetical protein
MQVNNSMSLPYYTVPFSFSKDALEWIEIHSAAMIENFQKNSQPFAGLVTIDTDEELAKWEGGPAWKEILEFANKYNLPKPDLQFFIYKKLTNPLVDSRGNPHIDTTVPEGSNKGIDGAKRDVPVRFNILTSGDEDQEMVWWEINRHHPLIEEVLFMRPNGKPAARLQVKGNTSAERWEHLKEPKWRYNNLARINEYASFVRTDILHALNWNGNHPRFIISLRFLLSWDEVMERVLKSQQDQ